MIDVGDVTVRIGEAVLLEDVTTSVRPGRVTVVIGPNGAGKTTLLRTASGTQVPSAGRVRMDNRALTAFTAHEQALRRAVLPQKVSLPFSFSVIDVVLMGRTPHVRGATESESDLEIAFAALDRVAMTDFADRDYATLSGGEQQRVHLARALAQVWDPPDDGHRYLLLDEPTASLDLAHQHGVLSIAVALAAEGAGVLAVLHDLNLAAQYADHVVVMRKGSIAAQGPPDDVLTPPLIRDIFDVSVLVQPHPCHDCPLVVPYAGTDIPKVPEHRAA
ncbi:heme ABC transporter ATP-binding protein [Longibacter sp.]|jgi:iron complex transport system ATP-binding protein|uniref:heme ABC transporter ATP-binding protein n=1 Tax=Longibacter sp. TaxID=2045415 RepID=UPI003EB9D69F